MFVQAIEIASQFTRPIHSISRYYGSEIVEPGAATLFFVNSDGWALTCRHVAELFIAGDQLLVKRSQFEQELSSKKGKTNERQALRELERKYQYSNETIFELYNNFVNCVGGPLEFEIIAHREIDMALIKFRNFSEIHCSRFPTFAENESNLKQGMFLCRLGFPFAEFTNYRYDKSKNKIEWTDSGRLSTPQFPTEGMVTRQLLGQEDRIIGFEMSTPGLRGQSGGPVFDTEGRIWGMQVATVHLDLVFDINQEVVRNGAKKRVKDSAFLHVGHCVHINAIKSFMSEHNVSFQEG